MKITFCLYKLTEEDTLSYGILIDFLTHKVVFDELGEDLYFEKDIYMIEENNTVFTADMSYLIKGFKEKYPLSHMENI